MRKKSQMEIMGIAIVVIILTIVIMFVVRWSILKEPVDHKKEFAQSEIASNLVNTMLSTSSGCKGLTFNELFQDCAAGETIDCGSGSPDSCTVAEDGVDAILSKTLELWKYKYAFKVGENIDIDECKDEEGNKIIERKAKTYPLPGGLEAVLAICG